MKGKPFGKLFGGSFKLYGQGFRLSLPLSLLYYGLPILLVLSMAFMMLRPLFNFYASLFSGLFSSAAIEDALSGLAPEILRGLPQTFLWLPVYLLVSLGYSFFLYPLCSARMAAINSASYQNAPIEGFGALYHLMDGRRWKPIVQYFLVYAFDMAVGMAFIALFYAAFFGSLLGLIASPVLGGTLMALQILALYLIFFVVLFILAALQVYAPLVGMNENLWAFDGLKRAFSLFKTRPWAFIGGSFLLGLMLLAAACLLLLVCALCAAPLFIYPLVLALVMLFSMPLEYAFYAQLYFDRVEAS
jgi:hypothetical protein